MGPCAPTGTRYLRINTAQAQEPTFEAFAGWPNSAVRHTVRCNFFLLTARSRAWPSTFQLASVLCGDMTEGPI